MAFNGSGLFRIDTAGNPVVTGTVISSTMFNALMADLANGLSSCITKDNQTATTQRINFASGIDSVAITDATSTGTGSIITQGGVGVAKSIYVGGNINVAGSVFDSANVIWYGAIADGVTDNTIAFQAAGDSGATKVYIPGASSSYRCGQVTFGTGVHMVYGDGPVATVVQATGTLANFMFGFGSGTVGLTVRDMSLNVNATTYATKYAVYLNTITDCLVTNLKISEGGRNAINGHNCINTTVRSITVRTYAQIGIYFDGSSSVNILADRCSVYGTGTSHGIQMYQGTSMHITKCYVEGAGGFGLNITQVVRGSIKDNEVLDTVAEGINIDSSSDADLTGNQITWTGSASTDYGISVAGTTAACSRCRIIGNEVSNSYKSGIALDQDVGTCIVTANTVLNCNSSAASDQGGILISGTNSTYNEVFGNHIIDSNSNRHTYAIMETTNTGAPNTNRFYKNRINGYITGPIVLLGATSSTDIKRSLALSNVAGVGNVTAANGGTITTASGTIDYWVDGTICYCRFDVLITTNGTGATSLLTPLPYTALLDSANFGGSAYGRAQAVSGKMLQGKILASSLTLVDYANAYPAVDSERLIGNFFFEASGI